MPLTSHMPTKIFNIKDLNFLRILLEIIATNTSTYIDYQSLSKKFGKI